MGFSTAQAASIECAAPKSKIENMVCSDRYLLNLDELLDHTYKQLKSESSSEDQFDVANAQRLWVKNVRDKCSDQDCLWNVYKARVWALTEKLKDFDCADYAQTTVEMDGCGRTKFEKLDLELTETFQALLKALEVPECCDSKDHLEARRLAIEAQSHWLKFRKAECDGHYETISEGSLRGSFYLSCATSLTVDRIKQLLQWGRVDLRRLQIQKIRGE